MVGALPVHFKAVQGEYQASSSVEIRPAEFNETNVQAMLQYKKPWVPRRPEAEGEEVPANAGTYLPCVPDLDLVVSRLGAAQQDDV